MIALVPIFYFTIWSALHNAGNVAAIHGYIYFLSAACSIYIYFRVAHDLSNSKCLAYFGENSLIIYGIHALVGNTYRFTGIQKYFPRDEAGFIAFLLYFVYIVSICSLLCFLYHILFRKRKVDPSLTVVSGL
jgi:fucose 4-O-acetylase-like acetyltransferase